MVPGVTPGLQCATGEMLEHVSVHGPRVVGMQCASGKMLQQASVHGGTAAGGRDAGCRRNKPSVDSLEKWDVESLEFQSVVWEKMVSSAASPACFWVPRLTLFAIDVCYQHVVNGQHLVPINWCELLVD